MKTAAELTNVEKRTTKEGPIVGFQRPRRSPASLCSLRLGHSFVITALASLFLVAHSSSAQSFSIDWFTIDGGGGTSTGGVFSVSGTLGQPDVGHMSGGNFTLEGGFWGLIGAIQTPGSPLLRVFLTSTNTVIVSWPAPSSFSLQQNSNLLTTNWTSLTNAVNLVGSENQVKISPPAGNRFYRLIFP